MASVAPREIVSAHSPDSDDAFMFYALATKKVRSAKEMLKENVTLERKILASYTERIKQAEEYGDRGLVNRLEDILAEETDHAEDLERLAR